MRISDWSSDVCSSDLDAVNDPGDEVPHLRMIGPAEAQRVHVGDRSRAHREDVAQYAADAGRRPLVRLDVAGVVVALHLEDGCQTVANVDHAGILAGAADHRRSDEHTSELQSLL